ncbi:MAG: DEAD/DEAH box helicase family protein [Bacilli bacterium]|nr:DEAD/DEAH box helicase family protein [Bacilli bacterium]
MTTIKLKPHQKKCVEACKTNNYGTCTDTCGSGKSYVECELIYDAFDTNDGKIVCYGAHRLDLIDQQFNSLIRYGLNREGKKYNFNSEKKDFELLEVSSAGRESYDHTTTIEEIIAAIEGAKKRNSNLLIYFCYASAERLYKAFERSGIKADLTIMDEAHYGQASINEVEEAFNRHLFRNVSDRMYFFTATPTELTLRYKGLETMPEIHSYNYGDALADGNVLPFTVHWMVDKTTTV